MFARGRSPSAPPVIALDESSPAPKYQQIVDQVRALVAARVLLPGAQLPSVRQLAADLGVNVNTVLAAYRALEAEGIVLLRRGSRAIIHPRLATAPRPAPADIAHVRSLLERVRTDALLLGLTAEMLRALADEVFAATPPATPPDTRAGSPAEG
jgi:GntR family transcriptional regulator